MPTSERTIVHEDNGCLASILYIYVDVLNVCQTKNKYLISNKLLSHKNFKLRCHSIGLGIKNVTQPVADFRRVPDKFGNPLVV